MVGPPLARGSPGGPTREAWAEHLCRTLSEASTESRVDRRFSRTRTGRTGTTYEPTYNDSSARTRLSPVKPASRYVVPRP